MRRPPLKTKQPLRFQGLFKVTNQIAGKWKTKSIMRQILELLFPKLLSPPKKKKWMNLTSNQLTTTSIKFGRFQNGCNKVVIELRVVQIWSAIILVISNWIRTASSFDFEITRTISAQIALHLVQLPLLSIGSYVSVRSWRYEALPKHGSLESTKDA